MLSTLNKYDALLVDAYGVFWDGADFIEGTKETLEALVQKGKFVIILSNTTQRAELATQKYTGLGLIQGKHYNELVTSGEVARKNFEEGIIHEGRALEKYYSFGTPNHSLFEGLNYTSTSLDKAEFIYIGIPQFTSQQKELLRGEYPLYESYSAKNGDSLWDTTEISAFSNLLEELKNTSLPVLNANPDIVAPEKCRATQTVNFVVRQGYIANELEKKGAKVHHFGKPYSKAYEFCRNLLPENLKNSKVAMIGDTVETDILGAHNATKELNWNVDGILTLTGNAMRTLQNRDTASVQQHLNQQFRQYGCKPNHIITSFGINGHLFL